MKDKVKIQRKKNSPLITRLTIGNVDYMFDASENVFEVDSSLSPVLLNYQVMGEKIFVPFVEAKEVK